MQQYETLRADFFLADLLSEENESLKENLEDIRERKGSYFTHGVWVEKSQNYLATVLGEKWQEEKKPVQIEVKRKGLSD